ncbi:glycosyltransferase [Phycicoccus endophyticus]|uniref:Glycosyltransferase n=1 Tax=Phycicoccus endophyticus TaxID=1690220 RepID=A0A7G9R007_9MICO|nr:glycosyltransferase family 2 protein [Phycicoccus endophyticus]NHI20792.1 glycosyltransferase [Phycicoccus endophyticus]QNN48932.1 glycosyltransferase [Phycicoccus endophyticus]
MPIVHAVPSVAKLTWGRIAITTTVLFWLAYLVSSVIRHFLNDAGGFRFTMEALSYLTVVTLLSFSALMYLVARQGALTRFRTHQRVPRELLDQHFTGTGAPLTVLVPSYAEEPDIVRLTLWSAALQEYPDLRVVLLLDDPPTPTDRVTRARLEATRAVTGQIEEALAAPRARAEAAYRRARADATTTPVASPDALVSLAAEYRAAAEWIEDMAEREVVADHVAEFFVDQVLMGLASELRLSLLAIEAAVDQRGQMPSERLCQLHHRLVRIFSARLGSFERKRFASLSQEANKAMNINAYLGLMGATWRPTPSAEGTVLRRVPAGQAAEEGDLDVPASEYVLTLDADSQLLRDYCLRLVYFLEQPENADVAITQTPYSSYRGAPTRVERIAGATTDIQHILHQGMSYHGATFWVGANAVIRRRALEDIVEVETVGGFEIRTYIQDRTVIEDTESSIDIAAAGWRLVNYPERLSYSATPPDFGSLVVQRRRWANGGLLILPKYWRQRRRRSTEHRQGRRSQFWLRVNYMASIAWASFALLLLLFYPYDGRLLSPLVVGAALPYFICMASDLKLCGHRRMDVFRIYGFNLVLLPVNLAGVLKSIQQAFTGQKIPFARTPKVRNRTAAPGLHVLVPYLIVVYSLVTAWRSSLHGNWGNLAFALFNAVLAAMAIQAYIGIRNSVVDMTMGVVNWLFVPRAAPALTPTADTGPRPVDWQAILYHGDRRLGRDLRGRGDRRRRVTHTRLARSRRWLPSRRSRST